MRRRYDFTSAQIEELTTLSRTGEPAHVRVKALALLHVAEGLGVANAAKAVRSHRSSVGIWIARYLAEGARGLGIRPGRGRKTRAVAEEVEKYVRQSPMNFDVPRTRWTLSSLARTVPSLEGMDPSGVWRVLKRLGLSYKRGQPRVHSPDPDYELKKGPWTTPWNEPETSPSASPSSSSTRRPSTPNPAPPGSGIPRDAFSLR